MEARSKLVAGLGLAGALTLVVVLLRLLAPASDAPETDAAKEKSKNTRIQAVTTVKPVTRSNTFTARAEATPTTRPQAARVQREDRVITGRVTTTDGSPIRDARVTGNDEESSTTTDADGAYKLTVPPRLWRMSAAHEDYATSSVFRIAPDAKTIDFILHKKRPVTLVGRVVRSGKKEPISKFTITSERVSATREPEPSNRFSIQAQTGDEFVFRIESEGFVTRTVREEIRTDAPATIEKEYELGTGGIVKGRVVRADSKAPVADATVILRSSRGFGGPGGPGGGPGGPGGRGDFFGGRGGRGDSTTSATTGPDGKFVLTLVSPGSLGLTVQPPAPLAETSRRVGEVQHGQEVDVGDIEVAEGGKITARLIRVPGDTALPDERLRLQTGMGFRGGDGQRSAQTDAQGEVVFDRLPAGRYDVVSEEYDVRASTVIEGTEHKKLTLRVGSGTLRGLVVKSGAPVVANVMFYRQAMQPAANVRTNEEGRFEISTLAPGKWNVMIMATGDGGGGGDRGGPGRGGFGQMTEATADVPELGVKEQTFVLPSGDIVGKVVNTSGEPVQGATVSTLASNDQSSFMGRFGGGGGGGRGRGNESGADGSFRISDQAPGLTGIMARKTGAGASEVATVNVPESGDSELVTLTLKAETGTLVSTVLDFESGQPLRDAFLSISSDKGRISVRQRRDEDGVLTITDLPPGTYEVEVTASGYTTVRHQVNIQAGQTETLNDVLSRAGALQLTVLDKNGAGVGNVACRLEPMDRESIQGAVDGRTDAVGYWNARGLLPGNYSLSAQAPTGPVMRSSIVINANQNTQEQLTLP